jgi:hypothetical protein
MRTPSKLDERRVGICHPIEVSATVPSKSCVIAREYGFDSWRALKRHVDVVTGVGVTYTADDLASFYEAVSEHRVDDVRDMLDRYPPLSLMLESSMNTRNCAARR